MGVYPHFKTHFRTLGTSFTKFGTSFIKLGISFIKFGTSDPTDSETPISTWIVHNFIEKPITKWLGVDPHFRTHFRTLGTSFTKFGTFFIKFGTFEPSDSETPLLPWMDHNLIWQPISDLFQNLKNTFIKTYFITF